jgi:EAL domain-containing protein (putative c-di-GMP-specific phosphodiesterase class I)
MKHRPMLSARILVVDDEAANVHLLEKALTKTGVAAVEGITDSTLAMARVREFEPDIVLLDLHMPPPDGFELLEQIGRWATANNTYLPVVVITADVTSATLERALAAGAADFLTKPFGLVETVLRVRNLVHTRRLHLALARQNVRFAAELDRYTTASRDVEERRGRILAVLEQIDQHLAIVYQPIVALLDHATCGHEALSRFSTLPLRPPNEWFADAAEAGIGVDLELAAVRLALAQMHLLPASTFLSVNVSPDTVRSTAFSELITAHRTDQIVIELTEHDQIDDYRSITDVVARIRESGARLAVDDTGAGFASLAHILKLQPDFIKLDRNIVSAVDTDPARTALIGALVTFSDDTGARLIAEGIETAGELACLLGLGVHLGQGYHLGRPGPIPRHAPHDIVPSLEPVGRPQQSETAREATTLPADPSAASSDEPAIA